MGKVYQQANGESRLAFQARIAADQAAKRASADKSPAYGTQQWAETYGDDLGESPDY